MSFGKRLQTLRHSRGITQEEFAQQLNVSRQAVSKWESSRGYPEMEKIIYICSHYGVSMDELFQDEIPAPQPAPHNAAPGEGEGRTLDSPTLKQSLSNFFANLSPHNQWAFGVGVSSVFLVLLVLFCLLCTTIAKGESDDMTLKFTWFALLILFSVGEAVTVGLTSIWFAVGALGALMCTLVGGNIWMQIGVFLALSALSLALVRPLARRFLTPGYSATNADRVIGADAVVTQEINNLLGQGQVTVAGQSWTARSEDEGVIPPQTTVKVLRIEGVKLYVTRKEE